MTRKEFEEQQAKRRREESQQRKQYETRQTIARMGGEDALNEIAADIYESSLALVKGGDGLRADYNKRYGNGGTAYRSDSAEWLKHVSNYQNGFNSEYQRVSNLLDDYGDLFDKEWINNIRSGLSETRNLVSGVSASAEEDRAYWKQFKDEKDYETARKNNEAYNDWINYDEAAANERIAKYEGLVNDYNTARGASGSNNYNNVADVEDYIAQYQAKLDEDYKYGRISPQEYDAKKARSRDDATAEWEASRISEDNKIFEDAGFKDYYDITNAIADEKQKIKYSKRVKRHNELVTGATNAADFEQYAAIGNTDANPVVKQRNEYERVATDGYGTNVMGVPATLYGDAAQRAYEENGAFNNRVYHYMTPDELKVYNYYWAKEQEGLVPEGTADEYLNMLEEGLEGKHAQRRYEMMKGDAFAEIIFGIEAGFNQFATGMKNVFNTEDDYINTNATQQLAQLVREEMSERGGFAKTAFDLTQTVSNMIPSIGAAYIANKLAPGSGAWVGSILMGTSAAGNAYAEALNSGMDKSQARVYSTLVGISETTLQRMFGGIPGLGGTLTGKVVEKAGSAITKFAAGINNVFGRIALKTGGWLVGRIGSALGETIEEFSQDVIEPYLKAFATGELPEDVDWEQALYSGLLGGLSSLVLGAPGDVASRTVATIEANNIKKNGRVEDLRAAGNTFDAETVAYKLTENLGENPSVLKMAELLREIKANIGEQTATDIKNGLIERGMLEKDAENMAGWVARIVNTNETANAEQRRVLETNEVLQDVMLDVIWNQNSTYNQRRSALANAQMPQGQNVSYGRDLGAERNATEVANDYAAALNKRAEIGRREDFKRTLNEGYMDNAVGEAVKAVRQNATAERMSEAVSENAPSVAKVESVDNGKLNLKYADGSQAAVSEAKFNTSEQAERYLYAQDSVDNLAKRGVNLSAQDVDFIVNAYSPTTGISPEEYFVGAESAIMYGYYGAKPDAGKNAFWDKLKPSHQETLYGIGRELAAKKQAARIESRDRRVAAAKGAKTGKAKVSTENVSRQTDKKKAAVEKTTVETVEKMAETGALRNDIVFYRSVATTENGETVYRIEKDVVHNGKVIFKAGEIAPNGMHHAADGTIFIDLASGDVGQGTAVFTLMHELGHDIAATNPEAWTQITDFYRDLVGVERFDALVDAKWDNMRRSHEDADFDRSDAVEDVVCDGLAETATKSDFFEKLTEYTAKTFETEAEAKGFIATVKKLIDKVLTRLKAIYKNLKPDTAAALAISDNIEAIQTLSDMAAKAYAEVGETRAKMYNTKAEGGKNSDRTASYDFSKSFAEQIEDYKKGIFPRNDTLIVRDTPEVLRKIGMNALPMTYTQKHLREALANKDGDHLGEALLRKLPEALENPIAIIDSASKPGRLVAIVEIPGQTRNTVAAIEIDGEGRIHSERIDSNAITSSHSRDNAFSRLLYDAVDSESKGRGGIYYWNKNKAISRARGLGVQFPGSSTVADGFIRSITDPLSKVNPKIKNIFETKQFKRWFGNSKVVNDDGTPKVMYHGTRAQFTVFDKSKARASGAYGKGFYFTDSTSHAGTYGDQMAVYLKIDNPLMQGGNKVTRSQIEKFLQAVAENEDYSIENYGTYDVNEIADSITSEDAFSVIQDVNATAIGDFAEAIRLFNEVNGTKFDGVITPTETVVYEPTQIKSATDNIGTFDGSNPDIRYSDRNKDSDVAPVWYSQMSRTIDGIKAEKVGANGVIPYLSGRGVKAEEIKWSGIATFLEGKKSVTKAELQQFAQESMLQMEEVVLDTEYDSDNYDQHRAATRWSKYTLDGGENYREMLFRMPNSTYSNQAMDTHWGKTGVLAHARMQDMDTPDGRGTMLLVEEIQSDWHNEGKKHGYDGDNVDYNELLRAKQEEMNKTQHDIERALFSPVSKDIVDAAMRYFDYDKAKAIDRLKKGAPLFANGARAKAIFSEEIRNSDTYKELGRLHDEFAKLWDEADDLHEKAENQKNPTPDAPFRGNYTDFVMKRLLRLAAEEGYTSIGWTTAEQQAERWSEAYSEGYKIEYDQDIPKFMRKYGKQWGGEVTKGKIYGGWKSNGEGATVWQFVIPDAMKKSILTEGQPMYSDRNFVEEKYYSRQIDRIDDLKEGAYVTVGKIADGSPLNLIGIPEGKLYFDVSKIRKEMRERKDVIPPEIMKKIPDLLNNPIVITEFVDRNGIHSANVYGNMHIGSSPVVVGVMVTQAQNGAVISKIQTVHPNRHASNDITDGNILYISPNKKETKSWFSQFLSAQMPLLEGRRSGFIRSISQDAAKSQEKVSRHSDRYRSPSNRELLTNALETTTDDVREQTVLNKYRDRIEKLNAIEAELKQVRKEIKDATFTEGPRDQAQLKALNAKAKQLENQLNYWDKKLMTAIEASKPLRDVLYRERGRAYQRAKQADREAQIRQRESRASTMLRNSIKRIANDFAQRMQRPTDRRWIPGKLMQGVVDIAEMIDPTGKKQDSQVAQKYRSTNEALLAIKNAYDDLKKADDYDFQSEYDEEFSSMISDLAEVVGDTPVRDMSYQQLQDVHAILSDIRNMIDSATKQIGKDETYSNYELGIMTMDEMEQMRDLKLTTGAVMDISRNWLTNPMRAVREMTGFKEDSVLNRQFKALDEGRVKADDFRMREQKKIDALRQTKADRKVFNDAVEKAYDFGLKDVDGNPLKISKMQAMQILLTYEREQANPNRKHLENDIFILDPELLAKGKIEKAFDKAQIMPALTPDALNKIVDGLNTEWDQKFMNVAREIFREDAPRAVNETTMQTKHRPVATEKAYIPYEVNKDFVIKENENVTYNAALENMGMLKSIMPNSTKPLYIRGLNALLDRHIDDVAKIYGLAIPVRNFNKVYNVTEQGNRRSVQAEIGKAWGKGGNKIISQAVADIQANRRGDEIPLFQKVKRGMVVAALVNNISVVIKQAASYPTAGAILSGKALAKGLGRYLTKFKDGTHAQDVWDEIDAHTPQHYTRRKGLSTQELGEFSQTKGWQNKVNNALGRFSPMKWIQGVDVATTAALWYACKAEVEMQGLTEESENYWDEVASLYNRVLEETQPMYDPLHRVEMSKNKIGQNVFVFQTQPMQNSGILRDGAMELRAAKKLYGKDSAEAKAASKKFVKAVASQTVSHLVFTAMTFLSAAMLHRMKPWSNDDDEVTWDSILKKFGVEFGKNYINALVPLVGNYGTEIAEKMIEGTRYDVLEDSVVGKINDTINAFARLRNPSFENFEDFMLEVASYLGVPGSNLKKVREGLQYHMTDLINGEFLSYNAGTERTTTQNSHLLYRAVMDGDAEQVSELKKEFKSESAYHTAIRKALRENDERITEAAKARLAGNTSEYSRLAREVKAEGRFSQDDIVAAINSEMTALKATEAEKDTSEQEPWFENESKGDELEGSIYKESDLNNAFERGDNTTAQTVIDDMVAAKVRRGKSEKDAKSEVRSSVTQYWKPIYLNASESQKGKIRKILYKTGLYGSADDVIKTCKKWV